MGFETPQPPLSEYLEWTTAGHLQLPDFQREYKWEDERIRSLLVTVLRGHPMGALMLLETGNDQVRFKPKALTGTSVPQGKNPQLLLLDGQQRLTSLTQALTGTGIVETKDAKGKLIKRRYYVDMRSAVQGDDAIDEAVRSIPHDGKIKANFDRDVVFDVSAPALEQSEEWFPLRLLYSGWDGAAWVNGLADKDLAEQFTNRILKPSANYQIPAIQLKKDTSKSAVATVFEKVNTGGVPLNVFELLTATFAGDADYFAQHGEDFRLNDDWQAIHDKFGNESVLDTVRSTDFLQGVSLLATRKRNLASTAERKPAVSARREDILRVALSDYLEWRDDLVAAFEWAAVFLANQYIFDKKFVPYPPQLVPLAVIRVVLGDEADYHGVNQKIRMWFWCGVLGELYGSSTETRFARDVEQVPEWASGGGGEPITVADALFQEKRLYTLKTRLSAAYKGVYALLIAEGAKDWIKNVTFNKAQYASLKTDIHHIFPERWSKASGIDPLFYNSVVNKTPLAADTNRSIGGDAPTKYLNRVKSKSGLSDGEVDAIIATHGVDTEALRSDDFAAHFTHRKEFLLDIIEGAMGKKAQRDEATADAEEIAAEYAEENDDVDGETVVELA
jgi:hypothetical protein